ncbi:hypothetical protein A3Q56_07297 [Intoshia linei]|uniref:Uncharacterized protein n=1 Tax=Intoshia linei TaxID=1819745 RepID=A0A177AT42_9BILA|nr:hypothetical protein A3Q56_07297 [Intoshia linei]
MVPIDDNKLSQEIFFSSQRKMTFENVFIKTESIYDVDLVDDDISQDCKDKAIQHINQLLDILIQNPK